MKLLFAFVAYLQLEESIASNSDTPNCNYAAFGSGGARAPLDQCTVSDKYHLSFMTRFNEETQKTERTIYHNSDCSGDSTFKKENEPTYTQTDTGKTCESAHFIYKWHVYDEYGTVKDIVGFEIEEEGVDGEKSSVVPGSRIEAISLMYDYCYSWGTNYMKIFGCEENVAGIEGNDVVTQQAYYDAECTQAIAPGDYVDSPLDTKEVTIATTISEGSVRFSVRDKETQVKAWDAIAYDVYCYKGDIVKKERASSSPTAIVHGDLGGDRIHFPFYEEPKNVPLPRANPLYNEPRAPLYNEPVPQEGIYYLAVNILVSMICTLCVIAVCFTAYYFMQKKANRGPVSWAKVEDSDV